MVCYVKTYYFDHIIPVQSLTHWMILLFVGGSTLADLQQALEDYLPVLLGLVKDGKSYISDILWL